MSDHKNSRNTTVATPALEKHLKKKAKNLKKEVEQNGSPEIPLAHYQDLVARQEGFPNWKGFQKELDKNSIQNFSITPPKVGFASDEDVVITPDDIEDLKATENRTLSFDEKAKILNNRTFLSNKGVNFSVFEPTLTGLKKSILDATFSVRTHFELCNFHFYETQEQGPEHKVIKEAYFLMPEKVVPAKMSLYRPKTKKGDPRMWFSGLSIYAEAGDQVAILIESDEAYLINLSKYDITQAPHDLIDLFGASSNQFSNFIERLTNKENETASELLDMLKEIAKYPIKATSKGDTAVGMAVERALGIPANSCKQPDYKGIELKAGRGGNNRSNLFAQVPDWKNSTCKKSGEILQKYGYERGIDFKLYCTVKVGVPNSQGLFLEFSSSQEQLIEKHIHDGDVVVWSTSVLQKRLLEKHAETFWIEAESIEIDGEEAFLLKSVVHTKSPLVSQLIPLIEEGIVTLDHLIKKSGRTERVSEKGPLLKIHKKNLNMLFPKPVRYKLT